VAMLPAFAHARRNSELAALVSGHPTKRRQLSKRYGVPAFSYEQLDECFSQVDAAYIALPNSMHAECTVRAANAGVHVLCEKPMAVTEDECRQMIEACESAPVKLMVAYRLHFDELNLAVIDLVHRGRIGEPKFFSSSFSMRLKPGNIRAKRDLGGGTLYDIGVYCINAARYLFRSEPKEVIAVSVNSGVRHLSEIDESTGAILRFDGERVAVFVSSFNAADVGAYRIVGTKGHVRVDPAYEYADALSYELTTGGKISRKRVPKRDQFAPELLYFSDCILNDRTPEPGGYEGLQDIRIVRALYESAEIGKAVAIPSSNRDEYPKKRQTIVRPAVPKPALVGVAGASAD
jgi:glucose-fructose oxidoreductase